MERLLIAQSGGPTVAINATVVGVLNVAFSSKKIDEVFGAVNGIQGVLDENFINLSEKVSGAKELTLLTETPSAALGSCRLKLKDLDKDAKQFEKIVEVFKKYNVKYFIYIGGNDSMDTVDKLSFYCKKQGLDITVVGAPKTIDNDLVGTDHCPGFGSAAKYIGTTMAEIIRDCQVYSIKAVTIVEVMGRNAGWLTAAAGLSRVNGGDGPDFIYLCEVPFDTAKFIADVKKKLEKKDAVVIAISEGIKNKEGKYISEEFQSGDVDAFGHSQIAGAGRVLESIVAKEIGCKVRSIEFSLIQRCASHIASLTDIEESKMLGMKACQCALDSENGMMASIERVSNKPYKTKITAIPVSEVSNKEKKVTKNYINDEGNDITEEMLEYLLPLIQGENSVSYKNGIPEHIVLY
ncbi:MAG: 6-phosphofructokinase [Lachnospirales bacterium]